MKGALFSSSRFFLRLTKEERKEEKEMISPNLKLGSSSRVILRPLELFMKERRGKNKQVAVIHLNELALTDVC